MTIGGEKLVIDLNLGLNSNLSQGYSSGDSQSANAAQASGVSNTDASSARNWSAQQATIAFERQKELQDREMAYNAKQAEIARQWQESMANTIYTRSVANMREAGINPILAANMGLSGASVGSGQTANIGGASAPMAQGFMDTSSSWSSSSEGQSSGWNNSENGIVTAISALAEMAKNALGAINAGNTLNVYMNDLEETAKKVSEVSNPGATELDKSGYKDSYKKTGNWLIDTVSKGLTQSINGLQHTTGGGYNAFR